MTSLLAWRAGTITSADGSVTLPADHGWLTVPERHDQPATPLIRLPVVRLRARTTAPGPPVVLLAGGPGTPGIQLLRRLLPAAAALLEVADLVTFDQRGTGAATPSLDSRVALDLPLAVPASREGFLSMYRERSRESAAYWAGRGVDLSAYTTVQNADDVAALRQALGAEQVSLFGASYGSHLGLAVIRRHGDHVSRAVLALVEGPDHTIKLPSQIQRHLADLDQRLHADPAWHGRLPSLTGALGEILGRLDCAPVTALLPFPGSADRRVTAGGFDARLALARGLGRVTELRRLSARVNSLLHGDNGWLLQQAAAYRTAPLPPAMTHVMDSASGLSPERAARIRAEAPGTLLGDLADFPFPFIGEAWGAPDLGAGFRSPVQARTPVLFISGSLDPRTPPANAEEVKTGFPEGYHLVVDGLAHESPLLVPAARDAITAFYRAGELPPANPMNRPFTFEEPS